MKILITLLILIELAVSTNAIISRTDKIQKAIHNLNINQLPIDKISFSDDDDPLILTEYLNRPYLGQTRSKVSLPELPLLNSHAGFFNVDTKYNSSLFMWFFPASNGDSSTPLLLWLQGGPGAPSTFAIFVENGPIDVSADGTPSIKNISWAHTFHVLYIDNPVGTGFSFLDDKSGLCRDEVCVANNLHTALMQFFTIFYQYKENDFYITGESYAGKYVPAIAYKIHIANPTASVKINMKGIAIGNGLVDPVNMVDQYGELLYGFSLATLNEKMHIDNQTGIAVKMIQNGKFSDAFDIFDVLLNGDIFKYPTYVKNITGCDNYFNIIYCEAPADQNYYLGYLNKQSTLAAIHVGNKRINPGLPVELALINDIMDSVAVNLSTIMNNYKVLIYNGQLDIIVGTILTEAYLRKLKWSGQSDYLNAKKVIWKVSPDDSEVAGYYRQVNNFIQLVVRRAGHMVPYDQPLVALDMIKRFVYDKFY